ncbi:gibberellin 20 oxidase 1-like isoform X2 [Chenopodium quinoa]|uniref:gibberellin 20 oxidase 1-like isoform X2 n=1 Tax=Chenopodium quinoa TaxID=63459 RepID=UPI000B780589|nr:gibberellin 20 oxidase 1-like isoform X2 [Chenopodium quinoa]
MSSSCIMSSNESIVFDPSMIQNQPKLPKEFIWAGFDSMQQQENNNDMLNEPLVDLEGFFKGDEEAIKHAAELINKACLTHGFFQVTNHRVDSSLIGAAHDQMDGLFKLPLDKKLRVQRNKGEMWGYSGAHAHRFSKQLPWKETFSFGYNYVDDQGGLMNSYKPIVFDYIKSSLGEDFEYAGWVYQRYCEAMKDLSLVIFELLAISLGIERQYFRKFFEDGTSLFRCNSYPPCNEPSLTFGTGPHCDPTSLTILHQDQVGGLEVFAHNKWQAVRPRQDAFVINIGDTFMAMSNGRYKSCLHRAVVNKKKERKSLVFFVNPKEDKIVRAPQDLIDREEGTKSRKYPDFKWPHLMEFTQFHYRADVTTLQSFFQWLPSSNLP